VTGLPSRRIVACVDLKLAATRIIRQHVKCFYVLSFGRTRIRYFCASQTVNETSKLSSNTRSPALEVTGIRKLTKHTSAGVRSPFLATVLSVPRITYHLLSLT